MKTGAKKVALRQKMRGVRRRLAESVGPAAAMALAAHVSDYIMANSLAGPVSAYWPMAGEMDCRLLLENLDEAGLVCALPVVIGKDQPLSFRRWQKGDVLVKDSYGLDNPVAGENISPKIVLAPLLAYDSHGHRLGQGGGFYDRTIAVLRQKGDLLVIGLAFAGQEVDRVPRDVYDEPLDAIATEKGIIWFNKDSA